MNRQARQTKRSLGAKTLALPAPVWVIGSYGPDGKPDLMVASWGGICCSSPPCLAVSLRTTRLTHANIMASRAFTVNIPSLRQLAETDYLGMVSGRDVDKFRATGLTAVKSELVRAPMVREFPLSLECRLVESIDLGSHTQFIGKIVDVKADEKALDSTGSLIAGKIAPLIAIPAERAYYALGSYLEQVGSVVLTLMEGAPPEQGADHRNEATTPADRTEASATGNRVNPD